MSPLAAFLAVNLLGAAAFGLGLVLGAAGPRIARAGAIAVLVLLVTKGVLAWLPVWEAAVFPWPWYAYLQGYWIHAIGGLFFGLAIPQLPVRWNRLVVACVGVAVLARGGWETRWIVAPEAHGDPARVADAAHHCRQSTMYTCAPSSCVTALSYVGVACSEADMARRCLTRREGTTVFNTYRGLALALEGTGWRPVMRDLPVAGLAVLGRVAVIDRPDIRHAIAVRGLGDAVLVHDPLQAGPKRWSIEDLGSVYGGVAITIEPR